MITGVEEFFAANKSRSKKLGITPRIVYSDPQPVRSYGDRLKYTIHTSSTDRSENFYFSVSMLESCCGVQELIRPKSYDLSQPVFDFMMEAVFAGLSYAAGKDSNGYREVWGNQILLTTSTESDSKYVRWVKEMEKLGKDAPVPVERFTAKRNPRTGNFCTVWRVVV